MDVVVRCARRFCVGAAGGSWDARIEETEVVVDRIRCRLRVWTRAPRVGRGEATQSIAVRVQPNLLQLELTAWNADRGKDELEASRGGHGTAMERDRRPPRKLHGAA